MKISNQLFTITIILLLIATLSQGFGQVQSSDKRYIRIGSLQNHYSAYGSERAWNNSYYEGLIWPAQYLYQDNAVIKRSFLGCRDYVDEGGLYWEAYGIYLSAGFVGSSVFPVVLKQSAKFALPTVIVDGSNVSAVYSRDIDEINPDQVPDRIVTNIINTSMGLTMNRTVYAFSQQYHDNYHIKIYTFTNTGNIDYDDEIERDGPLYGVRIGWSERYSVSREGSYAIGGTQSWGKHCWVTKRGEDYAQHYGEPITLANPIVQWIRCGFAWAGQAETNAFDNVGGPYLSQDGRLTAPHHAGIVVIHVDRSAQDHTDDPNQPVTLGWHAGDTYPGMNTVSRAELPKMILQYSMLSGNPHDGLGGNERFWETYKDKKKDPYLVHNDGGGTNVWINYGPFDLEMGDSVVIVEAEGINGLNRDMCREIGRRWKQAYNDPNDKGPFILPDGSTTDDEDVYKDQWVYTGRDSILLTFSRAKRNFDMGFQIPQPPQPPTLFEVSSGGDKISLVWTASPSEGEGGFGGYRIFRSEGRTDTTYDEIFACGFGTDNPGIVYQYDDLTAARGVSYYYYIVAFNDGSNNNTDANPHGSLHSGMFYTRTTEPAYLRRPGSNDLESIRIVPNPYYLNADRQRLLFPEEADKIMFYNIPGQCTIKIYTERGDLIQTIEHTDGSGDQAWYSVTSSRQVVVSGVYIAHIETPDGRSINKKFIIVR
ncbi:MAG: fibronectin [bacterium]|nr:MAG: fibronectin [bacterium]